MGKKSKVGKQRKDKFYHLAKETGYRSRSAFKLIQLNRKFEFLQKARVLVDLCAAPGGWLQVASKNMPVSSVIVGVDLFPIRAIPKVSTFVADITTDKCRQEMKKYLQGWSADCVLHDGAPNVGTNWLLDAHTQARLTLQALKLACETLKKGGWFITKVFRSRDYQALIWVFHQLFKKVHATKPQASRTESAEIFVVCQSYIAPDKIDSKFFDPTHIFKELPVSEIPKNKLEIFQDPAKKKKAKAVGYEEGDITLYHKIKMTDFLKSEDPITLLNSASELVFDVEDISTHRLTTEEIRQCCKDIKVLGRREIRVILTWHKNMKKVLEAAEQWQKEQREREEAARKEDEDGPNDAGNGDDDEEEDDEEVAKELAEMREEERKAERRKRKDALKKRKKLRERLHKVKVAQDMVDDATGEVDSLFDINRIKSKAQLSEVGKGDTKLVDEMVEAEIEAEDNHIPDEKRVKFVKQRLTDPTYPEEEDEDDSDEDEEEYPSDLDEEEIAVLQKQRMAEGKKNDEDSAESDLDSGVDELEANPLVVDLDDADTNTRLARKTNFWFSKDAFEGLEMDEDEDLEISQMVQHYEGQGGSVLEKQNDESQNTEDTRKDKKRKETSKRVHFNTTVSSVDDQGIEDEDEALSSDEEDGPPQPKKRMVKPKEDNDSSSDDESDYDDNVLLKSGEKEVHETKNKSSAKKDGFEIVSSEPVKKVTLDPEGLALGTLIATSKKKRREIIEHGYHRYTFGDEDVLPDWFAADEKEHTKPNLPVTKEMVAEYRERLKEINARPIKKIAEAKARRKFRLAKKLEKIRKKAEAIGDTMDVSEKEKMNQIKSLYKKAGLDGKKKKEVTYIVAKKGMAGKRVRRPQGIKGPYKVVDQRMKADMRGLKSKQQKKKKKKR